MAIYLFTGINLFIIVIGLGEVELEKLPAFKCLTSFFADTDPVWTWVLTPLQQLDMWSEYCSMLAEEILPYIKTISTWRNVRL